MLYLDLMAVLVIVSLISIVLDRRYVRGKRAERNPDAKTSGRAM